MTRALTLLNIMGDLTLVWEEKNNDEMVELIEKLMNKGITFFVIEPRMGGVVEPAKKKMKKAKDALKHRAITVPDEDIAKVLEAGGAEVVSSPAKPVRNSRVSKNAKEIARNESVGVRQASGG